MEKDKDLGVAKTEVEFSEVAIQDLEMLAEHIIELNPLPKNVPPKLKHTTKIIKIQRKHWVRYYQDNLCLTIISESMKKYFF